MGPGAGHEKLISSLDWVLKKWKHWSENTIPFIMAERISSQMNLIMPAALAITINNIHFS